MRVQRIVPNLAAPVPAAGHGFYHEFLGLDETFRVDGWVVGFRSPDNPTAQLHLVSRDATAREGSALSVGVDDVDGAYAEARRRGFEIVHPLTDEAWGVRRFFVRDPQGVVVNVVAHVV